MQDNVIMYNRLAEPVRSSVIIFVFYVMHKIYNGKKTNNKINIDIGISGGENWLNI